MTKTYIGCKIIQAEPHDDPKHDPNSPLAAPPGYAVIYADGYRSWSPKDVFEEAYVEVPADDAEEILQEAREHIEWTLDGGPDKAEAQVFGEAIDRARDHRFEAIHAAIKTCGSNPMGFTVEALTARAEAILAWIETGVAVVTPDAIRAAEDRGYAAARELDPGRVMIDEGGPA